MKTAVIVTIAFAMSVGPLVAQDEKPVPKDSLRVSVPGCTKGYIFTAGPSTEAQPGSLSIPEGMHLRMNGPKTLMTAIKAHEGSVIVITGLVKKGQRGPDGVSIGGVRIAPGPSPGGGSVGVSTVPNQILIDVEGWRPGVGDCPAR